MSQDSWLAVERYFTELLVKPDQALDAALADSDAAGLPAIAIAPTLGKLLHLMARAQGARSILEIGTLGGYSTIWLARALGPGGRLITLDMDPKHVELARANMARAGVADRVEIRLGKAAETLAQLVAAEAGPFDFIFIDADKESYADYLGWSLKLARPGTVIVADNVVRGGRVTDPATGDALIEGIRRFNAALAAEPRVSATALQTVGSTGYDGFAMALVTDGGANS